MMIYGYLRRVTAAIVTLFVATIALAACSISADNPPTIGGSSARDGYDIEITGREPLLVEPGEHNEGYLETKRAKLGHIL